MSKETELSDEQIDAFAERIRADERASVALPAGMPSPAAVDESTILHRMKYHLRPADPEIGEEEDGFDLYDMDIECADCIPVLIVRADAKVAPAAVAEPVTDAEILEVCGDFAKDAIGQTNLIRIGRQLIAFSASRAPKPAAVERKPMTDEMIEAALNSVKGALCTASSRPV